MFSSAEKTKNVHVQRQQQQQSQQTFFRKAGEESFFGGKESPAFFSPTIQAKLSVSSPDDPQEKEADAVADQVMRMPEPAAMPEKKEEEKVQKKEEEKKDETIHAKLQSPVISIQRKCDACEKENNVQGKLFRMIQRSEDASSSSVAFTNADPSSDYNIDRKELSFHQSDVIQRSGRGPPQSSIPFEQNLSSSKGGGSPLPGSTQQFMESRFNADFSGVRIHTGSYAENLSTNIHAQAFTHGNDIYFNSGKYSPHTEAGGTLLAHELTHTIQQGASPSHTSTTVATKQVARKNLIQRSAEAVPSQLTNAVAKAKTVEGKINAAKEQGDGFRTGWEHLLDIFKTTFGADMIVGTGGSSVKGAVAEQDIKKKRETSGEVVDSTTVTTANAIADTKMGERDAMPSWCGIFVFWALNKSGVPMPKWKLGEKMIKPEAARTPGSQPLPGDIAYRNAYSHFAIVDKVNGGTVTTVNGNTAGEDNLGGQVQTRDHPMSEWTAFFNPLLIMQGSLGSGEGAAPDEKPKTLAELRKEAKKLQKKEAEENDHADGETEVQAKQDKSNWHVDAAGTLHTATPAVQKAEDDKELQKKEEKKEEDEKANTGPVHRVQKKGSSLFTERETTCSESFIERTSISLQAKSESENSSLINEEDALIEQSSLVQDRGPPVVQMKSNGNDVVQRDVIDDALGFAGSVTDCISTSLNKAKTCAIGKAQTVAMHIPGYKALRVVLGRDPINGDDVARTGRNFIEAAFDIMPGGELLYKKLDEQHQLDAAAEWIDGKIEDLESIVNDLFSEIDQFWNRIGLSDLGSPLEVLKDGIGIALRFIDKVIKFAVNAAVELLEMVKKFLLDKIVDFIKEQTTAYPLLTVILGEDPITKKKVDRNGTNILNALLELGGEEGKIQRDQMKDTGTFQKVAAYIDEGIKVFGDLYKTIVANFGKIWDMVTIQALMEPKETFKKIYDIFAKPVADVLAFVEKVVKEILKLIKDVLFKRISAEAKKVKGYYLVTVLINKDPFTQEVVPRTVENLIHGFMSLMDGGEEQFQQMKESGAIDKAVNKINAAVKRLNMTFESVVQLFVDLWNSFTFSDFIHPIATFKRIIDKFGEPIGRLIAFVVEIVKIVVEVILIIMNFPFDLINNIIAKAMQAIELIKKDPIGFLKNLLRAIKEGFMQFFDNILTHLWNGLKTWFLGEVQDAGIPIPTDFSVIGIIKWLLAVLDITMEKIWKKLEERIGKPKVDKIRKMIDMAEKVAETAGEAYQFMKDVQERGFMTVMIEKVKEQLSNAWDMVMEAAKGFIMDQIIKKVTAKLLSMLDPTGIMAVVNSAIALYKAIQSFIKYLRKLLEIVNSFVEGTLQIAQGATKKAADFLEGALGRGIPIVIGFLANQVGLNLSERLKDALEIVREKVDKGLTWVIDKVVGLVEKLVSFGKAAVEKVKGWLGFKKPFTTQDGKSHNIYTEGEGAAAKLIVASTPKTLEQLVTDRKKEIDDENKANAAKASENGPKLTALDEALKTKKAMEPNLKKYGEAVDNKSDAEANELKDKINKQMDDILTKLIIAGVDTEGSNNIETNVQHTLTSNNRPSTVTALPLTKIPGNTAGSTPQERPVGWDFIPASSKPSTNWVGAHLLNHNLHGPGVAWNMVCGTKETNNNMKTEVENTAKKEVLNNPSKQYYFEAKVTYYTAQPPAAGVPAFPEIIYFPSKIDTEFGELSGEKGNFTKAKLIASRPFSQDSPSQTKTSMPSFNESSASRLYQAAVAAKKTVPENVMRIIVAARQSLPSQTFGDSVANMIAIADDYAVKNEGKAKGWFSSSYGANLTLLSQTDIFMNY